MDQTQYCGIFGIHVGVSKFELLKSGKPFPTCFFGGTRRHPPNFTLRLIAKNFTFSVLSKEKKEKHRFRAKQKRKIRKKLKFWIFHEKRPIWASFSSLKSFPGSSPVLARFLPGSCPVLTRFCPISVQLSRLVFLGFFNFLGFFRPFLAGTRKNHKKCRKFSIGRRKICKTQKFSLGMRKIAKLGKLHEFLWSGSTKPRKFVSLAAVGSACEMWQWYPA